MNPSPSDSSFKRKTLLINKKFQLSFISYFLGLSLMTLGIVYFAHRTLFSSFEKAGSALGLAQDHYFFKFLEHQQQNLGWIFLLTGGLVTFALMMAGIVLSHRVAGPMYRLKTHLDRVAGGGDLGNVGFRENDYFPEIADSMNRVMERMRKMDAAAQSQGAAASTQGTPKRA